MLLDQRVDCRTGERYQLGPASNGRILNCRRRMTDPVKEPIDFVVAQRRALLVRLQLGREREAGLGPAELFQQFFHRQERAGARIADVETLAFKVGELLHTCIGARQHRKRLGVHGEDGAQIGICVSLELALAFGGIELDVGLREPKIEFAGFDRVDVEHRAARRFYRATKAGLRPILIHQAADGAAHGVVHASDTAGSDGDEFLLRQRRCREGCKREYYGGRQPGASCHLSHLATPLIVFGPRPRHQLPLPTARQLRRSRCCR